MKVLSNGRVYKIYWEHSKSVKGTTHCMVAEVDEDKETTILAKASARCNSKDTYDKNKGRKLSMTRAMAEAGLPRATRSDVWKAYLNR